MQRWIFFLFLSIDSLFSNQAQEFVVVIPSYNNSAYADKNLTSVLTQNYPRFRVIYIDDCSTDDTFEKAQGLIQKFGKEEQVTLIRNERRTGGLANIYRAIHSCVDSAIIVLVDGDDWLLHSEVLGHLDTIYQNKQVWATYGSYQEFPGGNLGLNTGPIPYKRLRENTIRKGKFTASHLRTFYAKLFKKIPIQELHYQGEFFNAAWDLAFMYPILEMARLHAKFIPEILYIYNRETGLSDDKLRSERVVECANYIRALPPYRPLHRL